MKRIMIIFFALATMISIVLMSNFGIWLKMSDLTTLKSKAYQLEVKGINTQVYVFEVPEMHSICTIAYDSVFSNHMDCKTYKEMGIKK